MDLTPNARKETKGALRGRAGPSSRTGSGSGFTVYFWGEVCVDSRTRRIEEDAAALETRSLLDSPSRLGASKISRMLRSNEGERGSSTGYAAIEDILREDELEDIARVEVGRVEVEARTVGRAKRNGCIIV